MLFKDWSISAVVAGFLAVLIAYTGPLVIFVQAAHVAQVSEAMLSSWIWAISIGAAATSIFLASYFKMPIVTAWSAPGSALLVTLFPALSLNEAVGAYLTAAVILFVIGVTGYFDRLIRMIPRGIAAGMLAGILFQFGMGAFKSVAAAPVLGFGMIAAYLLCKRLIPRYALMLVLLFGMALAAALGQTHFSGLQWKLASVEFIAPQWSWSSTLSLALPLVLVSLTGQFLPGLAILRSAGYDVAARPILIVTSIASVATACFGGITSVLTSINAAICTSPEAHEDPAKRYVGSIANGVLYVLGALFAGSIVLRFTALPQTFIAVMAGLALIGAIMTNIAVTVQDEAHREASVLAFIATASGMTFLGLGSAFWGVVVGVAAHLIFTRFRHGAA
jgi:benzoate membrane transport protein